MPDEQAPDPQPAVRVRRGRSLMAKLVATFLVLSVVMVAAVAVLATQRARDSLEESVYGRLGAAQDLTRQSLVRWIEEQRRNLTFAAGLMGGSQQGRQSTAETDVVARLLDPESSVQTRLQAKEELRSQMQYIVRQTADAAELFALDENGVIVASTTQAHEGIDQSHEEYFTRGASGQFTRPVGASDLADGPAAIVSTPLFDGDGLLRGVLAANLDLGRVDRIVLQQNGLGDGGQTYLVDAEREFVHDQLAATVDSTIDSQAISDALADQSGRGQYADYAGRPVIGAYTWLPEIGAALVSEINQEQAFAPATELATTIAVIGVIVVLLMAILIYVASRRIAAPILSITETAVAVRGGDLNVEAPVRTRDEVGVLAETFNGMTAQLRESVATLERRVDERTAELATQKAYFEALVEISPAAVVTMDLDEQVTGWNPAATTLFGYQPEEAIGRSVSQLVLGTDEMRIEGASFARASSESGRHDAITRRTRKDGTVVDVEIIMVPLTVDGETVGSYVVYHDISELQAARQDADRANEAKSAFLATMSHEIRTPMNAIIGMSGLLSDTDLDVEQREYAGIIQGSGEALLAIINDILDFSKIEAGRMDVEEVPFSLRDCVESTLDLVSPLASRKGLDLGYSMSLDSPVVITGDPNRVRQILVNLLGNAVKFTDGGHIRVSASVDPAPAGVDRPTATISVTDTGIGLTEEQVGRLFQSFSQADLSTARKYGGTGLGLAISKRLAELMGGDLRVDSPGMDGVGSTFTLTLPVTVVEAAEPSARFLDGRRVLVVEPSPVSRQLLGDLMGGWGAAVDVVDDLAAASGRPEADVIVIGCSVADSEDVLDYVVSLRAAQGTPVVLSSAQPRRDVMTDPRWREMTAIDWLSKPIKPAAVAAALARCLGMEQAPGFGASTGESELGAPAARPLRILLAEDNPLNQKLAVTLLTRMGHAVTVAENGRVAVTEAVNQSFDLILMDVQMPEMDGLEATRRIIEALGDARPRIVALTANAMSEDRSATAEAGMDGYLAKPLRREELAAVLVETADLLPEPGPEIEQAAVGGDVRDAASPDPARPVDPQAFRERVAAMVGAEDLEFERELIASFLDGLPALVAEIESGADATDAEGLRRAAHTLKSHAAVFGAVRLEAECRSLEAAAADGLPVHDLAVLVVAEAKVVEAAVRALP